jgi:primosomal protein N' (replication factor Y)
VDEEHDPSYKQDNAPHYHARDVAEEKVRRQGAVLLLGSATPSLETHARVRSGGMERLALSRRVDDRPFPALQVVDMRKEGWYLSDALVAALRERLARQEQSLLFLNRRGYATRVLCKTCGWEARCPRCEVSLVHHKTPGESLRCHTCDHVQPAAARCPSCGGEVIRLSGRGTQRIAADLATLFPAARILRWDRDAMAARQAHERAYRDVLEGRVDIVVGTQMIAQGHDFPNLTLVGVVDADRSLGFPDFRAAERTFQLLMQVAGRAGRAERPGEVFVQTRLPGHYALRAALIRDYEAFAAEELAFRREAAYPPFTRIAQAVLRSRRGETAQAAAEKLARRLEAAPFPADAAVLGPAPAFHERQDGWSRWQVVIKAPPGAFEPLLARASAFAPPPGAGLSLNVDPEGMA